MPIPVIDLFAGPGGLGEGFSALRDDVKKPVFKIKLSIEMDEHAHKTLELRAFFREFTSKVPDSYYDYLSGKISRDKLFELYPKEAEAARSEAWHAEMGSKETTDIEIDRRIAAIVSKARKWVLIGGPPCQAYSLVGRSRVIGAKNGLHRYENDPRHRLYEHYLRILAVHQPPIFIMENVKGLLSAKVKEEGMFEKILKDLRNPSVAVISTTALKGEKKHKYKLFSVVAPLKDDSDEETNPQDFVVHAENYGIPQARHRIIILGIRSDQNTKPRQLIKSDAVTVEQVIGDLPKLRSGLSKEVDSAENWHKAVSCLSHAEWIDDAKVPLRVRSEILSKVKQLPLKLGRGSKFVEKVSKAEKHSAWFSDKRLNGVCNHETRGHIVQDLHRYFFSSVFAQLNLRSPLLEGFPEALLPAHKNAVAALTENKFNDRFRVQLSDRPSTTVVSHIAKDGHYFIHYDPLQCRSLTVREAARLQTFPDNYLFEGPRTEQYKQVGNAVPPLLAKQMAKLVADLLK